ncbi:MAG: KilA-N domain-containing protein [Flavobacteriales bacterium]|nr:KilA-N domain-containing protein [Flavobacteriales bacterium]
MKKRAINVKGTAVTVVERHEQDYISLTDMVQGFDGGSALIEQWLRNKDTVLFLGVWEQLNNAAFNSLEFKGGADSGEHQHRFYLSVEKVDKPGPTGCRSDSAPALAGHGGTYAHKDIAFEFGSWLSPEFKLYLIKEFQRLKEAEASSQSLEWNCSYARTAQVNYRIHTDAIKAHLIPPVLTKAKISGVYATEADLLNMALFGLTATEWKRANPSLQGNMRDHATLEQLVVLSNLESINAVLIQQGLATSMRLQQLNGIAIAQMHSLTAARAGDRLLAVGRKNPKN